jgi:parallel beta helix pectate lyase-like protein
MPVRSIGFLCVLASMTLFAGPAQSDTLLGCGSTLTESVTLDHDIGPCPEGGLGVEGGDVTLDLNGHTITGSGSGIGILIRASADETPANISVQNGSITGFGVGLGILAEKRVGNCPEPGVIDVDGLEVHSNKAGMSVFGFSSCITNITFSRNKVIGNSGDGIAAGLVGPIAILDNHVGKNGRVGIRAAFDSVRRIEGNFVSRNGEDGIHIDDTVTTVVNNRMMKNGGVGLSIRETIPTLLPRYYVADNVADNNGAGGMSAGSFPDPPDPPAGDANAAKHNGGIQCVLIVCAPNRGQAKTEP